ncbi:hypothetical protein QUF75_12230 [Desulfococcaceae bacterium HSG7]|nr:hypothetical protein [Desulfococcaceae bacterium HSG7]
MIKEFEKQQDEGLIKVFYSDESGFTLEPLISYAWWRKGENIVLPSSESIRINVLGFPGTDMEFQSFMFRCSVDTDVVEACFNYFSTVQDNFIIIS